MAKKQQTGQDLPARRLVKVLAWGLFGLGSTLVIGCSSAPIASAPQNHDPLHGVLAPPGIPQPTNSPKASNTSATSSNQQWGTPGDNSSTNNATLAGMSGLTPLGRPLPIDDNGRPLAPGQLTGGSAGLPGPNSAPKVEQVPDARPAVPTVMPTSSWQTPPSAQPAVQSIPSASAQLAVQSIPSASAESYSKQLQDRGVLNQKQEVIAEGLHLTCYVSAGPAGGLRILEVTAADYASAAQAILRQLDGSR